MMNPDRLLLSARFKSRILNQRPCTLEDLFPGAKNESRDGPPANFSQDKDPGWCYKQI